MLTIFRSRARTMERHAQQAVGFPALLDIIAGSTASELGRQAVLGLVPGHGPHQAIISTRALYADLMDLLSRGTAVPSLRFDPVTDILKRARPQESVLDGLALVEIARFIGVCEEILRFLGRDDTADLAALQQFSSRCPDCGGLRRRLQCALEPDGTIRDEASPELKRLRQRMRGIERELHARLDKILHAEDCADLLQERFVTVRNGRCVLPVRREAKSLFPGVVHDHSDSGRTLFMEPSALLPLGNELADARLDEQDECRRILLALTNNVRAEAVSLEAAEQALGELDAAVAVARWAVEYRCAFPGRGRQLRLINARHPLLESQFRQEQHPEKLVPLDLQLPEGCSALVITGSNSGGKTVAMKTVGLLVMAAQAGLPIPADPGSELPAFDQVYADIGDEQSLVRNLSTFTGHLQRVAGILRQVAVSPQGAVLVLLDELGTGTDPVEGGALACAILDELSRANVLTLATTHLSTIKSYVHERSDMLNANVRFNPQTLTPEYRLEVGHPGASHALQIASRIGMPPAVLEAARAFLDTDQLQLESLLERLEEQRRALEEHTASSRQARDSATHDRQQLATELETFRKERKRLLHEAYLQAADIVETTRKRMEQLVAELQHSETTAAAEKERRRQLRADLQRHDRRLTTALAETAPRPRRPLPRGRLRKGASVWVEKLQANARLESISEDGKRVKVRLRGLVFDVSAKQLEEPHPDAGGSDAPALREKRPRPGSDAVSELNLIGKRVAAALPLLDVFLDAAVLAGLDEVRIIHGFGSGRLQEAVQQHLSSHPAVTGVRTGIEGKDAGGPGVTVVSLGDR
jgi:DNA mismatch repair protein MutS2